MRKKILCILSSVLILSSLVGCKNNKTPVISQPQTTNEAKEFTKIDDLPVQGEIKYQKLADNKSQELNFKDDANYDKIINLLENYNKRNWTYDYNTFDINFFKYRDYMTSKAKENDDKETNEEEVIKSVKDKKLQCEYAKTNINSVIFSIYDNEYLIDETVYMFPKNDPEFIEQNKFYKKRYVVNVTLEDGNWLIKSWLVMPNVRAEEKETKFLFSESGKTIYLDENELGKMSELDAVKKSVESFYKGFYDVDYENMQNYGSEFLAYCAKDYTNAKQNIEDFKDSILKGKIKQKLRTVDYRLIHYDSTSKQYFIFCIPIIDRTSENEVWQSPILLTLIKEGDTWKISNVSMQTKLQLVQKN